MQEKGAQRYRLAARLSVFLPFVAFTASCVYQQIFFPARSAESVASYGWMQKDGYFLFSCFMAAAFLAGLVLSAIALRGGFRQGDKSTIAVATMGLVLNLGAVALTFVVVALLSERAAA